ncbi:polymorphic toxin-type HINT domain-containing protein [Paenibacillus macerans]|uniref:polymorphic toxin-type HINT domain-containing protein n=1 Tax=Paenibacillus macerans TaxID=44252 RepID=UPI00203C93CA|nr:polymorphic toxin-type HINT domain-containing protein [Paenibacillus macerans]MCM3698613.1 HINT domain-containing protein [Paenibacillus macerans]
MAYKEVTALYRNQRDDIIKLHIGEQVVETTDNHLFWVEGKGWVFADELQVGDKLQKADGSNLTIDKVEFIKLDEPVTVYNFTVADFHTYYVTDIGIWVHNTQCNFVDVSKYKSWIIKGTKKDWLKEQGFKEGQQYRTDILKTDVFDKSGKKVGEVHYFQKDVIDPNKYVPTHFQYIDPKTGKTKSNQHLYFND